MITEEELVKTISEKSKVPASDIISMIDEKEMEYSGMISRMGAAYIVGSELGIDLVKPVNKELKITSIVPNMQKVNFIGKIVRISPIREFETSDGKGKVLNIILGDETGTIRLSLWNERTEVVDEIKEGEVLEVLGGYTKKDYKGMTEVRLSNYGNLKKLKDVDIEVVQSNIQEYEGYRDIGLDTVTEDEFIHVKAYLVRIFERKIVQEICPVCRSAVSARRCEKHGAVNAERFIVASGVIDDGRGNMNAVFFRESAEFVLRRSVDDVVKVIEGKGEKHFFDTLDVMGIYLNIKGVVRKNKLTGNLELICHDVKGVNTIGEINSLLCKIHSQTEAGLGV